MASKKNRWRKRGQLEFRRETKRYSDGTPWGCDVLYVRIKGKACAVVEPFNWVTGETLSVLMGTYRAATSIDAAHMIRAYLAERSA